MMHKQIAAPNHSAT